MFQSGIVDPFDVPKGRRRWWWGWRGDGVGLEERGGP